MFDSGAVGEPVHGGRESVARVWPQQRRDGRAGLMEKIMSNNTSYSAIATSERELTEDDLALVSGGKPSAAKSSPAPKISESLSLSYEEVKFEYTLQ